MRFFNNLNTNTKLLILVGLLLSLSMIGSLVSHSMIKAIGFEIEAVAERDMPMVSAITNIEVHQLEQAVHVERVMRLMGIGRGNAEQAKNEIGAFMVLSKKVAEELVQVEKIIKQNLKAAHLSDTDKLKMMDVLAEIVNLEKEHKEYEHSAEALFTTFATGNNKQEAEHLLEVTEQEQEQINQHVGALLKDINTFTQKALLEVEHNEHNVETSMLISMIVMTILSLPFGLFIGRGISRPMIKMTKNMGDLADGDLDVHISGQNFKNEIGKMAAAVQVFKDTAIRTKRMEAEQEELKQQAEAQRRAALNQMADTFEQSVGEVVNTVTSASTELKVSATQMSSTANETSTKATTVAAASEEASTNVQTVASAAEELSASITEISQQVTRASEVAKGAVGQAQQSHDTIQGLVEAAQNIGDVVSLITDIAEQTNLLALNATIEAARAGDAGKGFAVVASEVKNLASQTANATDKIGGQINNIQSKTKEAANAIEEVTKTIGEIDEITIAISAGVEEQGAATGEIARNVEQAAAGTNEVSSNIQSVTQAANETGDAASQISSASGELSSQAERLREEVNRFLAEVRSDD